MSSPNAETLATSPPRARRRALLSLFAAAVVILVAAALWSRPDAAALQRELAAKNELASLGALVVMDAARTHVNSVNLSTLKSPDSIHRAIELLPALGSLRSLNVDGTAFRDEHASVVGQLGGLQDLVLSHTAITDKGLEKLTDLSRLKTIHLADTTVTNAAIPSLAQLRSLNIIDLSGTQVTGNLEPLCELPELTWLVAKRLTLDAEAIAALGQCQSLGRLSLNDTNCPKDAVEKLEQQKPNLTIDR
jgi:hypothetical protein